MCIAIQSTSLLITMYTFHTLPILCPWHDPGYRTHESSPTQLVARIERSGISLLQLLQHRIRLPTGWRVAGITGDLCERVCCSHGNAHKPKLCWAQLHWDFMCVITRGFTSTLMTTTTSAITQPHLHEHHLRCVQCPALPNHLPTYCESREAVQPGNHE